MILFAPGPPTPPLHRLHPAVEVLDRAIRLTQAAATSHYAAFTRTERLLQLVRRSLIGRPLRTYVKTGRRARQRRLL